MIHSTLQNLATFILLPAQEVLILDCLSNKVVGELYQSAENTSGEKRRIILKTGTIKHKFNLCCGQVTNNVKWLQDMFVSKLKEYCCPIALRRRLISLVFPDDLLITTLSHDLFFFLQITATVNATRTQCKFYPTL